MKVTIDKEKCIGCSSCAAVCPKSFEMDEDNKARLKATEAESDNPGCVQDAVDICPVQAIEAVE